MCVCVCEEGTFTLPIALEYFCETPRKIWLRYKLYTNIYLYIYKKVVQVVFKRLSILTRRSTLKIKIVSCLQNLAANIHVVVQKNIRPKMKRKL